MEEGRSLPRLRLDGLTDTQINFIQSDPRQWQIEIEGPDSKRGSSAKKDAKVQRIVTADLDGETQRILNREKAFIKEKEFAKSKLLTDKKGAKAKIPVVNPAL
jgi:hypothetical protein